MKKSRLLTALTIVLVSISSHANDIVEEFEKRCPDENVRSLRPSVGMSEEKFTCTTYFFYATQKINTDEYKKGYLRQYVFKDGWGIKYVYVRNGRISSISRSN